MLQNIIDKEGRSAAIFSFDYQFSKVKQTYIS